MTYLSKMRVDDSPRSGITELFSEDDPNYFIGSHSVLPRASAMLHQRAESDITRRHIQLVGAVQDLTKLDRDDINADCSNKLTCEADFYPGGAGVKRHGIYKEDSINDGQTVNIHGVRTKVPNTCPSLTLVEVLRNVWNPVQATHSLYHHKTEVARHDPQTKVFENIMTSRTIHHGETQRNLATRHGMEAQVPTRPIVPIRSRSRAIAIKRSSREVNLDEIRENTATAEYDWATWRMYNRIIDHRQKYPLNYHHEECSSGATSLALKHGMSGSHMTLEGSNQTISALSAHQKDYSHYGEVFKLDM